MRLIRLIFPGLLIALLAGCIDKTPYFSDINDDNTGNTFGAGDTAYVQLNPIWDSALGLVEPTEISIAQDGYVYIADPGANRIFVLDQSGALLPDFGDLNDLDGILGAGTVIDVDIDHKMNVFFIDGSERVYRWNQYWNQVGIDSIVTSATFRNHQTSQQVTTVAGSVNWNNYVNNSDWTMIQAVWGHPTTRIDSLLKPHLFYDGSALKNITKDIHYQSAQSRFSGITAMAGISSSIVASDMGGSDSTKHRLLRIDFERSNYILLNNGSRIWTHTGVFGKTLIQYGTGTDYVNSPVGLDADIDGNLYYTQTGIQFGAHKVKPVVTGSYITYSSGFTEGIDPIMDLERFLSPADVAVDLNLRIYVSNTGAQEIQVFSADGNLFKKAGIEEVIVDTSYWTMNGTDSTFVDTLITREVKGQLTAPAGLTVDDRGIVYVCDPPTGRVLRYRLSNVLDENIQPIH